MTVPVERSAPSVLAADPDEERRYRQIREVGPVDPATVAVLLDALADASWRVRHAAAERLAEGDPERAVPALVAALGAESTPSRRSAAAAALVQVGAPAIGALEGVLTSAVPELRTAAIEVLGDIADRRAAGAIAARLQDADPNTRLAAAEALGKIGGEECVTALQRALQRHDDAPLRSSVLESLARLRAAPAAARLRELAREPLLVRAVLRLAGVSDEPAAFEILAQGLAASSRSVREAALAGIGQQRLRRRGAPEALIAAIDQALATGTMVEAASAALAAEGGEVAVRAGAITILQCTGDPVHAPAIASAGEDEHVRAIARDALDALGPGCATALLAALPRLSPMAQVLALAALARWRDGRALALLRKVLEGDDDGLRGTAVEALGHLGNPDAVPSLIPLLSEADRTISGAAIGALIELAGSGPQALARVVDACRAHATPPPPVYRLLGRIGGADVVANVRCGLRSPHRGTRVAAAGALAALAGRGRVEGGIAPELLDCLADEDAAVRAAAAQALGSLARSGAGARAPLPRWAEATRALALALRDIHPMVRAAAALALGRCGGVEYAGELAEVAADRAAPAEVAAAAVHALAELGRADPALLQAAAAHPDPEVLKEVVVAASAVPGAPTARLLLSAATHPRWDVRRAAAVALGALGDRALREDVRRLASGEQDPLVRDALRAALASLLAGG